MPLASNPASPLALGSIRPQSSAEPLYRNRPKFPTMMQSPELLLSELNKAMRELRGAARVLDDNAIDAQLLPVIRRLTLAQLMSNRWLIAVGGTQGAGKTTLVRTLYGLQDSDPWLPANEGRGETLPVLIEESSEHSSPQGYAKLLRPDGEGTSQYAMAEEKLEASEFVKACRGQLPEVLLPVLRVPRRHFHQDGQALLLLPGYEKRTSNNETWQDLMRQGMVAAAGCVIVTDSTRLANQAQQDIVKDMLANELRTVRPLIVISKTEAFNGDEPRLAELRQTAQTAFALEGNDAARRVYCAGVGAPGSAVDYVQSWLPELAAALRDMSMAGTASRQVQLAKLEQILAVDLAGALRELRIQTTLFFRQSGGEDGGQEAIKRCLEAFDDACEDLRSSYQKMVQNLTGEQFGEAWENMQDRLQDSHEGLWNKLANTFDTVTQTQRRIETDVLSAWHSSGPLLQKYTAALGDLTGAVAGPSMPQAMLESSAPPLKRLGYVDGQDNTVAARFTDETVQSNLNALMRSRAGEVSTGVTNRDLEKTAKLLPVMALEYARIASALPQLVRVNGETLAMMPLADLGKSVSNVKQQFSDFTDASRGILKGIAAIMAIDIAADGHADIIDSLLSAAGTGASAAAAGTTTAAGAAGMTVGGAIAATIAIGYIAHCALQEVRQHDGQVRALANGMLQHTRDHHQAHFAACYDQLMNTVRNNLKQGLRRRFGLDQRLMEQDRLAKAMADVRILQRDLLSHLAQSGQTLALFDTAAA